MDPATGTGSRIVGLCNGKVVAKVRKIEIIFDGQRNCVPQRDIKLSIADERIKPGRVVQVERRRIAGDIGRKRIV